MKYLLAILLAFPTTLIALEVCMTGSWYDIKRDGEGINLEVLSKDRAIGYFYTFGAELGRVWYVMDGDGHDFDLYASVKKSDKPFIADIEPVGAASIKVVDDNLMIYSFVLDIDVDKPPWCLDGYCSGTYIYDRLTAIVPCTK